MSVVEAVSEIISALSVDFYAGWSFMDLINLSVLLITMTIVLNYYFAKADSK